MLAQWHQRYGVVSALRKIRAGILKSGKETGAQAGERVVEALVGTSSSKCDCGSSYKSDY